MSTATLILFSMLFLNIYAWDNGELELFDLVEEINMNFYEMLGISQGAAPGDIRKAYRKLSMQLHPDRNKAEDAELQFRQLSAVYEILKDEEQRKRYDHVLEFGLPDWRQPVYYYRKVRKVGLLETGLIVFVIFTVGHFLVIWAAYFEKRYEMEEVFNSRKKKERKSKKQKNAALTEEEEQQILDEILGTVKRPTFKDLLPFKCCRGFASLFTGTIYLVQELREQRKMAALQKELDENETEDSEEESRPRRKRVDLHLNKAPEMAKCEGAVSYTPLDRQDDRNIQTQTKDPNRDWTSEDDHLLAKAVARYPGGTSQRWEKIADMLERPVPMVIKKAKAIQNEGTRRVQASSQGITGVNSAPQKVSHLENVAISTRTDDVITDSTATRRKPQSNTTANDIASKINNTDNKNSQNKNITSKETQKAKSKAAEILAESASAKTKTNTIAVSNQNDSTGATTIKNNTINTTKKPEMAATSGGDVWSQNQQKIFEWGLTQYPKGSAERWEKIAAEIPGKSKEDCIARFKYLASVVQQKRKQAQA